MPLSEFRISASCYEGPLDLLVILARQGEVDVLELTLGEIARRYVESLSSAGPLDLDDCGEFLVLLSTLMELKSRRLVPTAPSEEEGEDGEDARPELLRQLLDYKRFREAAALLYERAKAQRQRLARQTEGEGGEAAGPADRPIRELELWDLVSAFSRLMKEAIVPAAESIQIDPTPVSVYMEAMRQRVIETGGVSFRDLLAGSVNRSSIIGKFLALLELVKQKEVWVELEGMEILVYPRDAQAEPDEPMGPSMPMADTTTPPDVRGRDAESEADIADAPLAEPGPTSAWDDFRSILDDDPPPPPTDEAR